jgi:hypothetical protein
MIELQEEGLECVSYDVWTEIYIKVGYDVKFKVLDEVARQVKDEVARQVLDQTRGL